MSLTQALLLGFIQGLTEFLPVSSSGHLVIFQNLFGLKEPNLFFDVALHFGTLLAILIGFYLTIFDPARLSLFPLAFFSKCLWPILVALLVFIAAFFLGRLCLLGFALQFSAPAGFFSASLGLGLGLLGLIPALLIGCDRRHRQHQSQDQHPDSQPPFSHQHTSGASLANHGRAGCQMPDTRYQISDTRYRIDPPTP